MRGLALFLIAAGAVWASDIADAVMQHNDAAARLLIANKSDVNAAQTDGTTALHWAARWDDIETAQLLIRRGAAPEAANHDGATPMFLAAQNGSAAMIELLLKGGAEVNTPVLAHGETALMMASRRGSVDAVRVLIEHGAQVNAKDTLRGTTALMWAAEQGHAGVVELLIRSGADVRAQSEVLRPLKRKGLGFAPVSEQGGPDGPIKGGLTALLFAARQGSIECVRALTNSGVDVNQTSADGSSPLLVAVQNGYYDIALYLMDHGATSTLPIPRAGRRSISR